MHPQGLSFVSEAPIDASSDSLEGDPRWIAIQRVLQTPSFARSARLSAFLEYVGRRAILGLCDEITEQQIGVHVFERSSDYNPGDDGIVRQNARQLRQRLALYYQEEGLQDAIRVIIPRGAYIPVFESNASAFQPSSSAAEDRKSARFPETEVRNLKPPGPTETKLRPEQVESLGTRTPSSKASLRRRFWVVAAGLILVGVLLIVRRERAPKTTGLNQLWLTLFQPQRITFVVPGDAGMKLFTNVAHHTVSVSDYASRAYLTTRAGEFALDGESDPLAQRRYTTMSDVNLIVALLRLPQRFSSRVQVVFAREFTTDELSDGNAVLIGAPEADPWVQLFNSRVDFSVVYGQDYTILDRDPHPNEPRTYSPSDSGGTQYSYAIISLTKNPDQTGHVLLLEGATMDQVQAAIDFLLNPSEMVPVLQAARGKNGQLRSFDALLQTTSYNGGSLGARLVSLHLHPQDDILRQ